MPHDLHQLASDGVKLDSQCHVLAQCELHDLEALAESREISLDFLES
jgi:hypothetical protein